MELEIKEQIIEGTLEDRKDVERNFLPVTVSYVNEVLKRQGKLYPMAWLMAGDNLHIYVGNFTESKEHKMAYAHWVRKQAKAINAWGYGFAAEAWMLSSNMTRDATKEEREEAQKAMVDEASKTSLSKHPDREEVAMIQFETKEGERSCVVRIIRDDDDKIVSTKIGKITKTDNNEGILTHML